MDGYSYFEAVLHPADVAVAGYGGDDAIFIYFAHSVVFAVGEVQVALGIKGHAVRTLQLGLCRRAAVAAETGYPRARDQGYGPVLIDLADAVRCLFRDIQVAVGRKSQAAPGERIPAAIAGPPSPKSLNWPLPA